jgi:hypothetical protein
MHPNIALRPAPILSMLMLIAITSCESQDRRLAEYAQRATEQQARQNDRIADQAQAVAHPADGTRGPTVGWGGAPRTLSID